MKEWWIRNKRWPSSADCLLVVNHNCIYSSFQFQSILSSSSSSGSSIAVFLRSYYLEKKKFRWWKRNVKPSITLTVTTVFFFDVCSLTCSRKFINCSSESYCFWILTKKKDYYWIKFSDHHYYYLFTNGTTLSIGD